MTGWFRRRSLKGGKSSKDSRRPSEPATTDYVSTSSSALTHVSSQEKGLFQESSPVVSIPPSFTSSSSTSIPPPPHYRHSQSRALPTIPASPQNSRIVQSPPPAFSRASSDNSGRAQRRHGMPSTKGFEPPLLPKSLTRPATSNGAPTGKSLPPLPGAANGMQLDGLRLSSTVTMPRPDKGKIRSDANHDHSSGRPKSAHVSGLEVSSLRASAPSASPPNSNFKRAKRKLSMTAPMLGFGRKDKDKA
ncbi:hypothetical protein PAXRUDRAFT_648457 [Paxillus rubicundulus Ve08.2h10]|uniref:Unplaced genomic scaffold scaffold_604, whole genome shotgun sequence n=1 Tax=Paxillus rubicundulus Ve08.2h10 TaxID=930991 RepID=A0A0D0E2N2_9AGAM|nr:hypothetical protein PAXRUDRAFT_648457 [Paxillus rubicundulus Ve08.2h10]